MIQTPYVYLYHYAPSGSNTKLLIAAARATISAKIGRFSACAVPYANAKAPTLATSGLQRKGTTYGTALGNH